MSSLAPIIVTTTPSRVRRAPFLITRLPRLFYGIRKTYSVMSNIKTTHLERTAAEPRDDGLYLVKLSHIEQINKRVRLLRLSLPQPIKFLPGQWLDTYVPGIPQAGGFTITSPPTAAADPARPYLELAVQASPQNPPAAWLWRPAEAILGQTLQVRIGGSFTFPPSRGLAGISRVVFVAGGVGINPIMSMMSYVGQVGKAEREEGVGFDPLLEFRVVYASKVSEQGVDQVLFLQKIKDLLESGAVNGKLALFLTSSSEAPVSPEAQPQPPPNVGEQYHHRRLAREDLRSFIDDPKHTVVYICGPPTMTDEIDNFLTSAEGLAMCSTQIITEKWW